MRVGEPVVRYNATLDQAKSMEKRPISTIFLGFYTYFSHFCQNLPIFNGFCASTRNQSRKSGAPQRAF
jgi:hypothetical protein